MIKVGIHDVSTVVQMYTVPPGTPKDRVEILRKAFQDTMRDADFLADAKKSQSEIGSVSGEEVAEVISNFGYCRPYS